MIAEPCIETSAHAGALALLLGAAVEGDLVSGVAMRPTDFQWGPEGRPMADLLFQPDAPGAADRWPLPATVLSRGRGDCAALVRVFASVWGDAVAVAPSGGDKLHAALVERGELWDPALDYGMPGRTPPLEAFTLVPIVRPTSGLARSGLELARRLGVSLPGDVADSLALASVTPSRLAIMAAKTPGDVAALVREILETPSRLERLLRSPTQRHPAALALLFARVAFPELRQLRPGADLGAVRDDITAAVIAAGELFPGCPGGCEL